MAEKMAYLIIAHRDDGAFRTLCSMLDDPRNDLFIHMDLKNQTYDEARLGKTLRYSRVYHCRRTSVTWGGFSQIRAELELLKLAVGTGHYSYCHLLSGQDLPIKSQDQIHAFFRDQGEKQFVAFDREDFRYDERVRYRFRFQEKIGRETNLWGYLQELDLRLQKLLGLKRNQDVRFQKGMNWFSITDGFARYVVDREKWIQRVFRDTYCADEIFLQTVLLNSPFLGSRSSRMIRLIDWERGKPYIFREADFEELRNSDCIFARKFQEETDPVILRKISAAFSPAPVTNA